MSRQPEHVAKNAARCDVGPSAWAANNQRLLIVTGGGEQDDVVTATEGGKRVSSRIAAKLNLCKQTIRVKPSAARARPVLASINSNLQHTSRTGCQ